MTQDEVIALAREVGIEDGNIPALAWGRLETGSELLTYFANAIEAKVKADLLAGAGEPVYWQYTSRLGNSYITEDRAAPSTDWTEVAVYPADQVAAAVLAEREECAKVCDEVGGRVSDSHAWDAAAAIRARGNKV